MSFVDPILQLAPTIEASVGDLPRAVDGVYTHMLQQLHLPQSMIDNVLHNVTVESGNALPAGEIHDAQPDQVINAETDLQAHHDDGVHTIDASHDAYASHDDASAMVG